MFAFLRKKSKAIDPGEDSTSFGNILKAMGAISEEDLEFLVAEKDNTPGTRIGELAEKHGFCSREDLEYAVGIQSGLRNGGNKMRLYAAIHKSNIDRNRKIHEQRRTIGEAMLAKVG